MSDFKAGDRVNVKSTGRAGAVVGAARYADLYPENIREAAARKRPRATPLDPDAVVLAVLLDGEARPRNHPAAALEAE